MLRVFFLKDTTKIAMQNLSVTFAFPPDAPKKVGENYCCISQYPPPKNST